MNKVFVSAAAVFAAPGVSVAASSIVFHRVANDRRASLLQVDAPTALKPDGLPQQQASNASPAEGTLGLAAAGKPIRIERDGQYIPDWATTPEPPQIPSHLQCGVTSKAHSGSSKDDQCPEECPFFAQDRTDSDFCTFVCVKEEECRLRFGDTQIGDSELGVCRSCMVAGCKTCDATASVDRCAECQGAYRLGPDGMCYFKYVGNWMYVVAGILVVILLAVVVWVVDMACRPCTNDAGLQYAETEREDKKLRQHKDDSGERKLWPLTTNLTKTQVAGPGLLLHFNFQVALIIWAIFVGTTWICFCQFVDPALWKLGTRRFGTPRNNCILVAYGHETVERLRWAKIAFFWIVYICSLLYWFAYGVYQLRAFQGTDFQNKTMKDFVAMVDGMPAISGEKAVEEDLKTRIESLTGQSVVGVSVAWDYQSIEEDITKALEADLDAADPPPDPIEPPPMNPLRRQFYNAEKLIFGTVPDKGAGANPSDIEEERDNVEELLRASHTSHKAFAVFETQEAMEDAVEKLAGGFEFEGACVTLQSIYAEPATVQWMNFGHSSASEKTLKLTAGFGIIGLACLFWAVVFYAPYAYYVLTFDYSNGRQPGFVVGFAFSMIVVIGNAIMYEVCARISDWVGFRFRDDREACYMILYTIACMFNVALDFVTTYRTAEKIMEGLGFRSWDGVPLQEITEFTRKFETYGMQRALAENSYAYAFPSTFLIPFVIEPFPTVFGPLWIGRWLVRSHPELQGRFAETWLSMAEMELGRYADLLLNAILGILIFYFPGGYTWRLFFGMAASHCWIYLWDQYKVLRAIPSCSFASFDIEWWAQALLAPIIAIIAAALAFTSNCHTSLYCVKGPGIVAICFFAWLSSTLFHLAVLTYVIPKFGRTPPDVDPAGHITFSSLASSVPCSWFTSNPVNCLRSKHFYKHSPPCSYFVMGKEDLMKPNKAIGCFYEEASK